jgi:uncharacterized repeat protein (TIGR01451 family)
MKKLLLLLLTIVSLQAKSQFINLPDTNLRNELIRQIPNCFNSSKQLDTTAAKLLAPTCHFFIVQKNITNLSGIEYIGCIKYLTIYECPISIFTKLPPKCTSLVMYNCSLSSIPLAVLNSTKLEELDLSSSNPDTATVSRLNTITNFSSLPFNIKSLKLHGMEYTTMPIVPAFIKNLELNNNLLTNIPNLPDSLIRFNCSYNKLTSLPNLPNSIESLICSSNDLISLPTLPTSLSFLDCKLNHILFLPILPNKIDMLYCMYNRLTALPTLPDSLIILDCSFNNLTTLPTLPNRLSHITCKNNKLISLPKLPSKLYSIDCENNKLIQLPTLPNSLIHLYCSKNYDLECLPSLPLNMQSLDISNTKISCLPNIPAPAGGLYLSPYNFPKVFCSPTNNVNNCASFPNIIGTVYVDENNNNTKDPNEPFRANVPVRLKANNKTVTNINGAYTLMADSIGGQTLTITAPRFYTAVPSTINFNFNKYDTLVNVPPIALQKTLSKDSLAIKITPINWAARPGFAYPFFVQYENVGSNTVNANINISFNSNALNYDSSSTTVNATTGNIQLMKNSFTPGSQGGFISYFKVKPNAALLGTNLKTWATIAGGATTAADTTNRIIGGSYDPNDKLSTPRLSTTQVAEGEFINYTVRFQNTGTDTAFTVVIADTLSSLLQTNTFEMLGSSHTCKTIIQDNKIYFEFRNILLPDSTTNLIGSNGFVNFRIKSISSVVLNTIIPNKAAIYFDYNEPIITNTATTTISNIVLPNKLLSFNAALQTNKNVLLFWTTTNEVNMKEYIVEESADGVNFKTLAIEQARNQNNNSYYNSKVLQNQKSNYYFRLKMLGNDGAITYSNIIKINLDGSAQALQVVTNPVKDKLCINVISSKLQNTQAQLVNNSGKLIKTIILKLGNQSIDVANLSAGLYYLKTIEGVEKIVISQ